MHYCRKHADEARGAIPREMRASNAKSWLGEAEKKGRPVTGPCLPPELCKDYSGEIEVLPQSSQRR